MFELPIDPSDYLSVLHGVFRDPFWPHQKLRQRVFQMQRGCQAADQAGRDPDRREALHIVLEVIPVCVAEEGKCAQGDYSQR